MPTSGTNANSNESGIDDYIGSRNKSLSIYGIRGMGSSGSGVARNYIVAFVRFTKSIFVNF